MCEVALVRVHKWTRTNKQQSVRRQKKGRKRSRPPSPDKGAGDGEAISRREVYKRRSWAGRGLIAVILALLLVGCRQDEEKRHDARELPREREAEEDRSLTEEEPPAAPEAPATKSAREAPSKHQEATQAIEQVLDMPGLPGAPAFENGRSVLLARAKNEPNFFVRTPEYEEASEEIDYYRWRIRSARSPWTTLRELLRYFRSEPRKGRLSLLRQGYLYAEDPEVAFALVGLVGAHHLFDSQRIWVERGERLFHAKKKGHHYVFEDGPKAGQPVRLLLLDRIGGGSGPDSPALHRDFRSLRYQLAFDRARVRHITEDRLVVDLRYGGQLWIPTLLRAEGPHLELLQEKILPRQLDAVRRAKDSAHRRMAALQVLRGAMLSQIEERLPFDEPRTEVGQQDGILRRAWSYAYERDRETYHVHDDRYQVFDRQGRPLVPQVCVDFLLDTFERASGTWWQPRGQPRARTSGALDFQEYQPRLHLRRSRGFLEFATTHDQWFEVIAVPPQERIALGHQEAFFSYLALRADDFASGDMVFIRGKTPWDEREEHTHSFFVYETDPLTGVPIAVAGNASRPVIWSWEAEARRTPLRTLRYRVRPTMELLRLVTSAGSQSPSAPAPPPLVP